jgi:hypothetical protein
VYAQSGFAALTFTSSRSRKLQHQRVRPTDSACFAAADSRTRDHGVVEQAGSAVRDLREGDRVVIDQGLNCVSAAQRCFVNTAARTIVTSVSFIANTASRFARRARRVHRRAGGECN